MKFSTICHDGFFNKPDKVRDWALTLDYGHTDKGTYPGIRTKCMSLVNPRFHDSVCSKLLALYGQYKSSDWSAESYFQKIKRYTDDPNDPVNVGWKHIDGDKLMGAVIYLDPKSDQLGGTNIYKMKDGVGKKDFETEKYQLQTHTDVLGPKQSRSEDDLSRYREKIIKHSNNFDTTIKISNVYNRSISYDGSQWHGQSSCWMPDDIDFRLTLVVFVNSISNNPLDRFYSKSRYV
tara:strand:+ start:133 stop:834 length:702 start_codon:yes stop_codon:yes gene_type:complete